VEEAITGIDLSGKNIRHGPSRGRRGDDALPKTDIVARGRGDSASATSSHEGAATAASATSSHECAATAESARSSHEGAATAPSATSSHEGAATAQSTTSSHEGAATAVSATRSSPHASSMGTSSSASGENSLALTAWGGGISGELGRDVKSAMVVFFVFHALFFVVRARPRRPRACDRGNGCAHSVLGSTWDHDK
jgi:hypothetical protein